MSTPAERKRRVRQLAEASGLAVAAVTSAEPFPGLTETLEHRRTSGMLAGMDWFTPERAVISANPRMLHEHASSIISVGIPYYRSDIQKPDDGITRGRIARYAWGADYHDVLKRRMQDLASRIELDLGTEVEVRTLVDTARIVDRAVAARSGLGWYGKHTNIIVPGHSSFVMLGEILIDLEIESDQPLDKNCGKCRICLNKCPTGAIVEPYAVSAPLCISFQTIEQRGAIPRGLRPLIGDWVFGCDHCQDVCPYTGAARDMYDEAFAPRTIEHAWPSLTGLLTLTREEFASAFRASAVKRAKRVGLARNAAVALGNIGADHDFQPLSSAATLHDEPLVRGHAAWALGHRYGSAARATLVRGLGDSDEFVREECRVALEQV